MYNVLSVPVAVHTENLSTGIFIYKIDIINKQLLVVLEFVGICCGKQLESVGIVCAKRSEPDAGILINMVHINCQ
jgi:hypothetical protein